MTNKFKRLFAAPLIKSKRVDGFEEIFIHYYQVNIKGEPDQNAEMESFGPLLASREDPERLHDLLCQALDLPRPNFLASSGDTEQ